MSNDMLFKLLNNFFRIQNAPQVSSFFSFQLLKHHMFFDDSELSE